MLTRSQIQKLAQLYGIGLQAQERDYIQHILLFLVYRRTQKLVFKGGTALRIVYHGNRYSEDLDFNAEMPCQDLQSFWEGVVVDLSDFGIPAIIRNQWKSDAGYSLDVSYQGPLFDGRDRTKGKIRVDMNLRIETVQTNRELVSPEYDDLRPFVITTLTPDELLAEKVRAFLIRKKPRDIYDIWLLSKQGIELRKDLLEKKLETYGIQATKELWEETLAQTENEWERDMRALLPQFIPWESVMPIVKSIVK